MYDLPGVQPEFIEEREDATSQFFIVSCTLLRLVGAGQECDTAEAVSRRIALIERLKRWFDRGTRLTMEELAEPPRILEDAMALAARTATDAARGGRWLLFVPLSVPVRTSRP